MPNLKFITEYEKGCNHMLPGQGCFQPGRNLFKGFFLIGPSIKPHILGVNIEKTQYFDVGFQQVVSVQALLR
jgi:hypothetical protein